MKEIEVEKKDQAEKEARERFLAEARSIPGYAEWKEHYDEVLRDRHRRMEAFELVLKLIPKFDSFSLFHLAWTLGITKRHAGKILREWRRDGKVILLTEQTIGHPYRIIVNH